MAEGLKMSVVPTALFAAAQWAPSHQDNTQSPNNDFDIP
jgi:hypothetical protein